MRMAVNLRKVNRRSAKIRGERKRQPVYSKTIFATNEKRANPLVTKAGKGGERRRKKEGEKQRGKKEGKNSN